MKKTERAAAFTVRDRLASLVLNVSARRRRTRGEERSPEEAGSDRWRVQLRGAETLARAERRSTSLALKEHHLSLLFVSVTSGLIFTLQPDCDFTACLHLFSVGVDIAPAVEQSHSTFLLRVSRLHMCCAVLL